MKAKIIFYSLLMLALTTAMNLFASEKSAAPALKEEQVTYTAGGVTSKGYLVFDDNIKAKRPAVLIVPEWWGLNDYAKTRAKQLAALGYIALAVDLFGEGKVATNPKDAQDMATPFYKDPQLGKTRLDAAIIKIKEYPQTDAANVVAIGYCFGGAMVLNAAKLGSDLKAVVSFHGGLAGVPANKDLLKAQILVCHGASDKFVSQKDVDAFKHQLDSIGYPYTFKVYPNATHAFTNPASTSVGKQFNMPIEYNAEADKSSWNDMNTFLASVFQK